MSDHHCDCGDAEPVDPAALAVELDAAMNKAATQMTRACLGCMKIGSLINSLVFIRNVPEGASQVMAGEYALADLIARHGVAQPEHVKPS